MSPVLQHFLASAFFWGKAALLIVCLYKLWPRKRHFIQGFNKTTPGGLLVEQTPGYLDLRSRLVVCLFICAVLCLVAGDLFRRTFLPPAPPPVVAGEPAPVPQPRIARSSAARAGDIVKIVCGSGKLCAVAAAAPDAAKLGAGHKPSGKVFSVKNGTKAIVIGYDPQETGTDTADVYILADANATSITLSAPSNPDEKGCIPGRWMHKIGSQESVMVYQLQDKKTQDKKRPETCLMYRQNKAASPVTPSARVLMLFCP